VEVYRRYKKVVEGIQEAEELLGENLDVEMAELAKEELADLKKEKDVLEERIKILLLPKDPNDDKNIIMEIRGAAGGDEAALFAGDLFNMYQKYAET
ncbi:PCRF domain-containing protein, partial [Enterococcus faecalis]